MAFERLMFLRTEWFRVQQPGQQLIKFGCRAFNL